MLFADDSALVTHRAEEKKLVDNFARAASQFSLKINIRKKTECLYQPVKNVPAPQTEENITIRQEGPGQCKAFKYLGSIISDNARLDQEITYRISRASATFGRQQERLWKNRHVIILFKC